MALPKAFAPVIHTTHVFPPIPVRDYDWCAWYDNDGESGNYGYGKTEDAAIQDLRDNYDPPED